MGRTILIAVVAGLILGAAVGVFVWMTSGFLAPDQPEPTPIGMEPQPESDADGPIGALIRVSMEGRVGVNLDDIPENEREGLVQDLFDKPTSYWEQRAIMQVRFTTLRRNYGIKYGEAPLPLPPEELWNITVTSAPRREERDGHDFVLVDYTFESTLLSDVNSPAASADELGKIGGTFKDKLILPLDPEFVFQRTRFACMNESESPPNSIDAEEADFYYDQKCGEEPKLSNIGCHQTEMPTESCEDAVVAHIGASRPTMIFERLPWNSELADAVRTGEITNPEGPDLQPIQSRFEEYRFTYRYIPEDSCTLVENCVGGSGWRQLMMFPTGDINTGALPLDIGRVDYFHTEGGSLLADHGVYEFSACHEHYHFSHYGSFTLGYGSLALNHKQAFCLQPTSRLMNHELSPLNHPYSNCIDQGVAIGWIDEYQMGLECQWLDVSDVAPQILPISFTSNPDGMMCEGTLKFDEDGNQLFEPTEFKTTDGEPVDRPQCDFYPGWYGNNTISYEVEVPPTGEGYITEPCKEDVFGLRRNCGFERDPKLSTCEPGTSITLTCSIPAGSPSQVLRVCEASKALRSGIPCTFSDSLATEIIQSTKDVTFTCPEARDDVETGGSYSFFTGSLFPEETSAAITCVP